MVIVKIFINSKYIVSVKMRFVIFVEIILQFIILKIKP
jgi:hypothetical protein